MVATRASSNAFYTLRNASVFVVESSDDMGVGCVGSDSISAGVTGGDVFVVMAFYLKSCYFCDLTAFGDTRGDCFLTWAYTVLGDLSIVGGFFIDDIVFWCTTLGSPAMPV
jgi:hypothetical protein